MSLRIATTAALLAVLAIPGHTQDSRRIRFARGASSATVEGAVVRGETARYRIGARAGQRLRVTIRAAEDNAVFQLLAPGGRSLPGAGDGDDARRWSGPLPATGDYTIVVGGTRGNASYRLTVAVR